VIGQAGVMKYIDAPLVAGIALNALALAD